MKKLIILFSLLPATIYAQNSKQDSIWLPMKFFIGGWTGKGSGEPGMGEYERSYKWLFTVNSGRDMRTPAVGKIR
jgi:hypothetical protein